MADETQHPISVQLIWQVRDGIRRHFRLGLAVATVVILLGGLSYGIYTIDNGESGALLRFGALIDDSVSPGLHYRLPLGIDEVVEWRTGEVFRLQVGADWDPKLSLVTGDENFIDVTATVQYRIRRLGEFLFAADAAETLVHQTLRAELLEAAAALAVDDLLTSAKGLVQQRVQTHGQQRLDSYGLGIDLVSVNLQAVDPPPEAEESFVAVLDARADAARGISLARTRADHRQRLARGKAAQILSEAEAEADRRHQEARGAAQRFDDLLVQKRRSPELTRTDLYSRGVREALAKVRLIVLPPGETDRLDLNLIDPEP